MRRRFFVAAMALSAGLGVLASFGVASASTLDVDGGVLQTWDLKADVPVVEVPTSVAPAMDDVPVTGDGEPAGDPAPSDGATTLPESGNDTDPDSDGPAD